MAQKKMQRPRSYVQSTLLNNEATYHLGSLHWAILVEPSFFVLLSMSGIAFMIQGSGIAESNKAWFMLLLLPCAVLIQCLIYFLTTESAVTNSRVLIKTGWISRMTDEIALSKVESILMKQGIVGRMFNFGNVVVIGTGGNKVIVRGIAHPMQFRAAVHELAMSVK